MARTLHYSGRFKRQFKKLSRSGNTRYLRAMNAVLHIIVAGDQPLPARHLDHALTGEMSGWRECHIAPDWLLIYHIMPETQAVYLVATGTHSELF